MQAQKELKRKQLLTFYAIFLGQLQQDQQMTIAQKQKQQQQAKQYLRAQYLQYLLQLQSIKGASQL